MVRVFRARLPEEGCPTTREPVAQMACTPNEKALGGSDRSVRNEVQMLPLVQCPPWCACWPAGPFTDAEQRFLNGLEILVTFVPFSQKPCDYIRDRIVGVADTPQRRAHMLSVPIRLRGYYSMTSIAFLVCDKGVQGIPRAWDAWPLCPELAIVEYAQGWPSGSLIRFQHPGRASHGMSLLHCSRFSRPSA